uniref:Synapse-associated protein 1-like n=1 Tax=Callorhinchus milii TaxID=7868 RepID=A0A4W3JIG9_CALMI
MRDNCRICFHSPLRERELGKSPVTGLLFVYHLIADYLYNAASSATKKVSESVRGTAQTIKKSVEERKIDDLFNKTIIGDFKKEQEKFVKEKKSKKSGTLFSVFYYGVLYFGFAVEQFNIAIAVALFPFDPPAGVQFNFEFDRIAPVAMVMLREDELLNKVRFDLVPKLVKEEQFWRNYFYRVSLIKQSAELSLLAAQHTGRSKRKEDPLEDRTSATGGSFALFLFCFLTESNNVVVKRFFGGFALMISPVVQISTSLIAAEFASDAYHTLFPKQDNLLEGMEMLGMSADDIPEWEKELQRELQEFEIVEGSEQINDAWEKEIEEMLEAAADSKG